MPRSYLYIKSVEAKEEREAERNKRRTPEKHHGLSNLKSNGRRRLSSEAKPNPRDDSFSENGLRVCVLR